MTPLRAPQPAVVATASFGADAEAPRPQSSPQRVPTRRRNLAQRTAPRARQARSGVRHDDRPQAQERLRRQVEALDRRRRRYRHPDPHQRPRRRHLVRRPHHLQTRESPPGPSVAETPRSALTLDPARTTRRLTGLPFLATASEQCCRSTWHSGLQETDHPRPNQHPDLVVSSREVAVRRVTARPERVPPRTEHEPPDPLPREVGRIRRKPPRDRASLPENPRTSGQDEVPAPVAILLYRMQRRSCS